MKKLSTLLFGVTIAVVALFAFGVQDAQAVCSWSGVPNEVALVVVNNTSLDAGHNNLTIGVNGSLSGDRNSTTPECEQEADGPAPFCSWADVSPQTSPANTVSITSGPAGVGGQSIAVSVTPGTSGTGCFDPGTETRFNGSRTLNVSALANGTYNFTVQVTDTFGRSDTANGSFTINRAAAYQLSVSKAGTGSGTVTSSPAGINCGADCSENYTDGTSVTLSQSAAAGSTFAGWSGACSGTGSCVVSMTQARSVTATFNTSGGAPTCSPASQTVAPNASASFSASGGTGSYTWSGGGSPATGSGSSFSTSYSTTGSKTVTVTSGGLTATCSVTVATASQCNSISVSSNKSTNWLIGGPQVNGQYIQSPGYPTYVSSGSYTTDSSGNPLPTGSYGILVDEAPDGWTLASITPSANQNCSGSISFTLTYNPPGGTPPDGGGPVSCSGPTIVAVNTNATFNASGGTGTYSWSTSPAGSPASAPSGASFTTKWTSTGNKTVTAASGGSSSGCAVCVGSAFSCQTEEPPTAQVRINGFTLPQTVNYMQPATVSWSSTNSTSCIRSSTPTDSSWDEHLGPTSGSRTVARANSTTYSVNCRNSQNVWATASNQLRIRPECLPAGQTASVGQTVNLTARGGNGTYAWTASGGTPGTGTGGTFNVSYATPGTKTVTVASQTMTSYACTVTVSDAPPSTGTVAVQSNIATTWSVTGPSGTQTQGFPATNATYENQATGSYTISNVPDIEGYTKAITPSNAQWLSAGETKTFTITYTSDQEPPGGGEPGVDIRANGSDGPVLVLDGSRALLAWEATGVVSGSCVGTSQPSVAPWGGDRKDDPTGSEWSPEINEVYTFVITCEADDGAKEGSGALVSDSVEVGPRPPQCSDRAFWASRGDAGAADNDGDGMIDEEDPGCWTGGVVGTGSYNPTDDLEYNEGDDGPPSDIVTDCNDGLDNDGDGKVDHESVTPDGKIPDDGCKSPLDPSELDDPDIREI